MCWHRHQAAKHQAAKYHQWQQRNVALSRRRNRNQYGGGIGRRIGHNQRNGGDGAAIKRGSMAARKQWQRQQHLKRK